MMPLPCASASSRNDLPSKLLFFGNTVLSTHMLSYQFRPSVGYPGMSTVHSTTSWCSFFRTSGSRYARSFSSSGAIKMGCQVGTPRNTCVLRMVKR